MDKYKPSFIGISFDPFFEKKEYIAPQKKGAPISKNTNKILFISFSRTIVLNVSIGVYSAIN